MILSCDDFSSFLFSDGFLVMLSCDTVMADCLLLMLSCDDFSSILFFDCFLLML